MVGNGPEDTDEEILNVLREADEEYLPTTEIAEELSNGKRRTGGRLNELEGEGRVEHKELGQTYIWTLADEEHSNPVKPGLGDIVRRSNLLRHYGKGIATTGKDIFIIGGVFVLVSLTANLQGASLPLLSNTQILIGGYMALVGGGGALFIGEAIYLSGVLAPQVAEKYVLERESSEKVGT